VLQKIASSIADGSYNTLSSARIIYGLEAYAQQAQAALENTASSPFTVQEVLSKENKKALKLKGKLIARGAFSEKARSLEIRSDTDTPLFYQVSIVGFDLDNAKDVPESNEVEIIRELRNLDGTAITEAEIGNEVEVVLKLRAAKNRRIYHLAIVDLLPGGFEVVLGDEGNRIGTSDSDWSPDYADLREDRVLLYGDVGPDLRTFVYRIKAVNRGTFAVPPAYMKSMYDPKVGARTGSGGVTVVGD
jgi:uncharacterized protein YfaS (alpha-2-macroglobulin family)